MAYVYEEQCGSLAYTVSRQEESSRLDHGVVIRQLAGWVLRWCAPGSAGSAFYESEAALQRAVRRRAHAANLRARGMECLSAGNLHLAERLLDLADNLE